MSFNQFTNLDFADLRAQIKDYLRVNSDFADFDFEGSNFSTLIDLLAYNTYITAYNTNMAVKNVSLTVQLCVKTSFHSLEILDMCLDRLDLLEQWSISR